MAGNPSATASNTMKYVWVLAFAKSIDLPGVQHQYDKVASLLRNVHSELVIDVIPSVVEDVVGAKNEVFIGMGVANESSLDELAEMVEYRARLLQGTIPGETAPFLLMRPKFLSPFAQESVRRFSSRS